MDLDNPKDRYEGVQDTEDESGRNRLGKFRNRLRDGFREFGNRLRNEFREVRDRFRGDGARGEGDLPEVDSSRLSDNVVTHEDSERSVMKPQTRQIDGKDMEFTFVENASYLGGAAQKYTMKDEHGGLWLFKVLGNGDNEWGGKAEVAANKLLKKLDLPSVEMETITLVVPDHGRVSGTIQKMFKLKKDGLLKTNTKVNELTPEQRKQLQELEVFDNLICDRDRHGNNFGIDFHDNLVSFDRGEALGYREGSTIRGIVITKRGVFDLDTMFFHADKDLFYGSYYSDELWPGALKGEYDLEFTAVEPFIKKIEDFSEAEFLDILDPYAEEWAREIGKSKQDFKNAFLERKRTTRSRFDAYYKKRQERRGN